MRAYKGVPLRCIDDPLVRISLANLDTYSRQTGRAFSNSIAKGPTPNAITNPTIPPGGSGSGTGGDFIDSLWAIADNLTPSKRAKFQCSGISPNVTRTFAFPNQDGTLALTTDVFQAFPVGSLFITTHAYVNGAAVTAALGYGSWSTFGAGRVLIGDDGGTYTPGEATGGAATHTHSVTSNVTAANYSNSPTSTTEDIGTVNVVTVGGTTSVSRGGHTHNTDITHTHTLTNNAVTSGSGSTIPPYIVVYMWKRLS